MRLVKTHYKIFFTVIIVFILLLILSSWNFGDDQKIVWGVTFSKKQCDELGLNWREVYQKILAEMHFKVVRLPMYWDEIERQPGEFDFGDYAWMVDQAAQQQVEIVLVLGRRVPRWPECHVPGFYKNLSETAVQEKILDLLKQEIIYFKKYSNLKKWQLDNEPFLSVFGECPQPDSKFLNAELALIRSLDSRPIMLTESGELSTWLKGAKLADILGISMYRRTWNKNWGYFSYPLQPAYYFLKAQLIKHLTGVKEIVNTELQVEPWTANFRLKEVSLFDQLYATDLEQVKENIVFARRSGINEIYLWGVEWWWWMGTKYNNWDFWEYGKTLNH